MASQKATYWMAVGLLALIVGNHFVSKISGTCLAYKARAAAERMSGRASSLMAVADVMLGRTSTRFDRAQAALAMSQARLASVQTNFARREAVCARVQAVRAQMMVREQLEEMEIPAVAPRAQIEMMIPAPPVTPDHDPI
jgi:hypothetical protein